MNTTCPSLLERLRQPANGDAWPRFVRLYTPLLHYWVRRTGFNEAEADDLVQEVFSHLVKELPRFTYDKDRTFRGWLRTVARNKWNEIRRRRQMDAQGMNQVEVADCKNPDPAEMFAAEEYRHLLYRRALEVMQADFPGNSSRAFQMVVLEGHTAAEAAAGLGMTVGAVHQARFRVLARLREELAGLID